MKAPKGFKGSAGNYKRAFRYKDEAQRAARTWERRGYNTWLRASDDGGVILYIQHYAANPSRRKSLKALSRTERRRGGIGALSKAEELTRKLLRGLRGKSKKNPGVKTISLKNFTGKVRINPGVKAGAVQIAGVGKRGKR